MGHNRRPSGVPPTAAISLHRRELALGAKSRRSQGLNQTHAVDPNSTFNFTVRSG
jgi:hypothetical protein